MDAQKKIQTYICKKPWVRWVAVALLAAAAVLLIAGIIAFAGADNTVLSFAREDIQPGSMASLEIVGVSHWLYRTSGETYYAAVDALGNGYTLVLSDRQFAGMNELALYYLTQSGEMPAPVTLTGCVLNVSAEVRSGLAEIWAISPEEYDSLYGSLIIDCTTTARQQAAAPFLAPAALLGIVGLAVFLWDLRIRQNAKRCLARLKALGKVEEAAAQLADLERCTLLGDDRGKLTEDFLFGRDTGIACLRSDIVWIYRTEKSRLFLLPRSVLVAGTHYTGLRTAVNMKRFDRLGITEDVIRSIAQSNPALLTGKTRENMAAFRKLVK